MRRRTFAQRAPSSHFRWLGLAAIVWSCKQPTAPAENAAAAAPAASAAAPANGVPPGGASFGSQGHVIGPDNHVIGPDNSVASPPAAALSASEGARLDAVMTPELVFPAEARRSAYRALAPEVKDGKRSYSFELSEQPGMIAGQHFHSITFVFARAGTMLKAPGSEPEIMSAGGPQGSFVRASARSADGAYDVSVMERMLLPDTLPRPGIRADTALVAVLERLARQSAP